jgi:penicillin-binding protein A
MFASSPPPRGSVRWLEPGRSRRRLWAPMPGRGAVLAVVLLVVAAGAAVLFVRARDRSADQRDVARRFARAWARGDTGAMWALLGARAQDAYPRKRFAAGYRTADRQATVTAVRVGEAGDPSDGRVPVPVAVRTRLFGTLHGTVALPVTAERDAWRIDWSPGLRLPGLRDGERVRRRVLRRPRHAAVQAADGRRLDSLSSIGAVADALRKRHAVQLAGRPAARLRFGRRVVARAPVVPGRPVHTTIRPSIQRAAVAALGGRLGGVAVLRPRDGAVLALAGFAVSAPQPPGSTFKIITLSGALEAGIAKPSSTYPIRSAATLSGVLLRNASNELCGGTLVNAFVVSCNSVFAPLGAKLGARRLVRTAEAFGFNERPRVPLAKPNRISQPRNLKDDLAVGAAAIGQDRDLATPLGMASVGATIGAHGVRAKPRIVRGEPVQRRRVVSPRVARQVRSMMLGVVRGGTGTAAALPGVAVAGKTGTAELVPTASGPPDPRNTDAWFVAFAPAPKPKLAVGVMLVGAGAGGASAAPIARQVLQAAL